MLKVLFIGDIVGRPGRLAIQKELPKLKAEYEPDLVIANAENLAHGTGVTTATLKEMLSAGVDFFTSGNHIWKNTQATDILAGKDYPIIRPANYPEGTAGDGCRVIEVGTKKVAIINIMGRVFMKQNLDDPFRTTDVILNSFQDLDRKPDAIIIDAHMEATSEAVAYGWYLDGRVSAVLGTHTHIPTADERILPEGTGYITDVGMTGPRDSVLGVDKDIIIKNFLTQIPQTHQIPEISCRLDAVYLEINTQNKKCEKITRISRDINI